MTAIVWEPSPIGGSDSRGEVGTVLWTAHRYHPTLVTVTVYDPIRSVSCIGPGVDDAAVLRMRNALRITLAALSAHSRDRVESETTK